MTVADHARMEHHRRMSEERGRTVSALRRAVSVYRRAYEDLWRQHEALRVELARLQTGPPGTPPWVVAARVGSDGEEPA